jgi:hypothetical protein
MYKAYAHRLMRLGSLVLKLETFIKVDKLENQLNIK